MNGEQKLIERIRKALPSGLQIGRRGFLRLGIGDDAAVIRPAQGADWVVTCDAFLENVHFLADVHPADSVGYKALARATSDLAAMGAVPRWFLLSLALTASRTRGWLEQFLRGMGRAARQFGLVLVGGDTSQHATVAVSLTVIGEIAPGRAVTRAGARPGDILYVSGTLGAAQLGLELILRQRSSDRRWKPLLRPHLYPELCLEVGQWLARRSLASAMIDTSDGLSTDLAHICTASGVGARLWLDSLPAVRVPVALRGQGFDAIELALHGGEDYELLFAVPRRFASRIPATRHGVRLTPIGEITREKKLVVVDANGRAAPLVPRGWDHFRERTRRRS